MILFVLKFYCYLDFLIITLHELDYSSQLLSSLIQYEGCFICVNRDSRSLIEKMSL